MTIDYTHYQAKLEAEKKLLETEMEKVGRQNPDAPNDWEATPAEGVVQEADETDAADNVEDFNENTAILNTLETRYNETQSALERIQNQTYGLCQVCGKEIEADRLEVNPSASTCKTHM